MHSNVTHLGQNYVVLQANQAVLANHRAVLRYESYCHSRLHKEKAVSCLQDIAW